MILRVVRGRVSPGELDAVVEAYRRDYVPIATQTVGLDRYIVGAHAASDGGHDLAAVTLWTTVEGALAAFDGDLGAIRTIDGRPHGELLLSVDHYEIDPAGERAPRPGTATRVRLAVGQVARGLDADIQQELRRQVPDLPDEALDAVVGRRVLGADVEIALVTTWSAEPDGVDLATSLWPAISSRYSTFRVAVHDILLQGAGAG